MQTINLLGVYGAGNDTLFGGALRGAIAAVQADARKYDYASYVFVPRIMDYLEQTTVYRLVRQWRDPTIIVTHSCGGWTGTQATIEDSMSPFPYVAVIAPSIYCYPRPVMQNVRRIEQFTSNVFDFFNPGGRTLVSKSPINNKTEVLVTRTGLSHLTAPNSSLVHRALIRNVREAVGVKIS